MHRSRRLHFFRLSVIGPKQICGGSPLGPCLALGWDEIVRVDRGL